MGMDANNFKITAEAAAELQALGIANAEGMSVIDARTKNVNLAKEEMRQIQQTIEADQKVLLQFEKIYDPPQTDYEKKFFTYNEALFTNDNSLIEQLEFEVNKMQDEAGKELIVLMEEHRKAPPEKQVEIEKKIRQINLEYMSVYAKRQGTIPGSPNMMLLQEEDLRKRYVEGKIDLPEFQRQFLSFRESGAWVVVRDPKLDPSVADHAHVMGESIPTNPKNTLLGKAHSDIAENTKSEGKARTVGLIVGITAMSAVGIAVGFSTGFNLADDTPLKALNNLFDKESIIKLLTLKKQKQELLLSIETNLLFGN